MTAYEAMSLEAMIARVQKYNPGDGYKLVEKAYRFAQEAHAEQERRAVLHSPVLCGEHPDRVDD